MTTPVLQFADYAEPFLLETDASGDGLGAVLSKRMPMGNGTPLLVVVDLLLSQKGITF